MDKQSFAQVFCIFAGLALGYIMGYTKGKYSAWMQYRKYMREYIWKVIKKVSPTTVSDLIKAMEITEKEDSQNKMMEYDGH